MRWGDVALLPFQQNRPTAGLGAHPQDLCPGLAGLGLDPRDLRRPCNRIGQLAVHRADVLRQSHDFLHAFSWRRLMIAIERVQTGTEARNIRRRGRIADDPRRPIRLALHAPCRGDRSACSAFSFEHDERSVFGDFDSMRTVNPLGRIPSLILPDGTTLIDSAAILDWLDQTVGPERALLPPGGASRQAGAAAHRACDRHDRQGDGRRLRAAGPSDAVSLAGLDRPLPHPGRGRPCRAGGPVLAGRCARSIRPGSPPPA